MAQFKYHWMGENTTLAPVQHWSDCGLHDEPIRPCDCFHVGARIEHKHYRFKARVVETTDSGMQWESEHGLFGHDGFEDFKNWRRI